MQIGTSEFKKSPLTDKTVLIMGTVYVKEEAELKKLAQRLRRRGYRVKRGETMNGDPASYWHASLRDDVLVYMGKCGHCGGYVSRYGIFAHGRDCELCGKPLAREYVDGGTIDFAFADDHRMRNTLCMQIKEFRPAEADGEVSELILYPETLPSWRFFVLSPREAGQTLSAHRHQFRVIEENGRKYIAIPHRNDGYVGVINPHDVHGGWRKGRVVRMFEGEEYPDIGGLPTYESLTIKPAWAGYPLAPSPTLHETIIYAGGNVARIDYHYQDDRPAFTDRNVAAMHTFVEHFTTLDLAAWDDMVANASRGGPSFIRAAARFCQGRSDPVVTNKPNIGNAIETIAKISDAFSKNPLRQLTRRSITQGDVDGLEAVMEDRDLRSDFLTILGFGR